MPLFKYNFVSAWYNWHTQRLASNNTCDLCLFTSFKKKTRLQIVFSVMLLHKFTKVLFTFKCHTILWHMCTCMSFLYQFSCNSYRLTSLWTNSYTKFHLNWSINVECKDRNLFMPVRRVLFSLHSFPQYWCSLSRFLHVSLVPNFFPTWAKNVENRAKIIYTPVSKGKQYARVLTS